MNLQEELKSGKRFQPLMKMEEEEEQESYFNRIKRQKYEEKEDKFVAT